MHHVSKPCDYYTAFLNSKWWFWKCFSLYSALAGAICFCIYSILIILRRIWTSPHRLRASACKNEQTDYFSFLCSLKFDYWISRLYYSKSTPSPHKMVAINHDLYLKEGMLCHSMNCKLWSKNFQCLGKKRLKANYLK